MRKNTSNNSLFAYEGTQPPERGEILKKRNFQQYEEMTTASPKPLPVPQTLNSLSNPYLYNNTSSKNNFMDVRVLNEGSENNNNWPHHSYVSLSPYPAQTVSMQYTQIHPETQYSRPEQQQTYEQPSQLYQREIERLKEEMQQQLERQNIFFTEQLNGLKKMLDASNQIQQALLSELLEIKSMMKDEQQHSKQKKIKDTDPKTEKLNSSPEAASKKVNKQSSRVSMGEHLFTHFTQEGFKEKSDRNKHKHNHSRYLNTTIKVQPQVQNIRNIASVSPDLINDLCPGGRVIDINNSIKKSTEPENLEACLFRFKQ